ncbi:MFS transporter [Streptomyces sp. NPDC005438]|uniref:MFS transporter n=1 Tax=Streptomyces sp. NPDC005438 TaxID=3156880 RepID=UPI0033B09ADE
MTTVQPSPAPDGSEPTPLPDQREEERAPVARATEADGPSRPPKVQNITEETTEESTEDVSQAEGAPDQASDGEVRDTEVGGPVGRTPDGPGSDPVDGTEPAKGAPGSASGASPGGPQGSPDPVTTEPASETKDAPEDATKDASRAEDAPDRAPDAEAPDAEGAKDPATKEPAPEAEDSPPAREAKGASKAEGSSASEVGDRDPSEDGSPDAEGKPPEAEGFIASIAPEERVLPQGQPDFVRRWPPWLQVLAHPVPASMLVAGVLHALWLWVFASSGGDLAAQDAWAEFVSKHPDSAYNLAWYGGMHPVSYSVISPYLMAVLGVRSTMVIAGVPAAGILALILVRARVPGGGRAVAQPLWPALWGAFAISCNAFSGRVTFAVGTLFALAAAAVIWAWPERWRFSPGPRRRYLQARWFRAGLVVLFSALATAGSPVAGLFLEVVAASLFLCGRRQAAYAVAVSPPLVVAGSALIFPFTGIMPMPLVSLGFTLAITLGIYLSTPRSWRIVRVGTAIYALGTLLTWLIPSQVGSNVERMGLLLGGVVLLCVLPLVTLRSRRGVALLTAFVVAAGWQIGKPTWDVVMTTPDASWARELAPLLHELKRRDVHQGRVEVVPVSSHREASALSPHVNLARGWNRQADAERNPIFYDSKLLTPDSYHEWLRRWAVRYVVLPSDDPDVAGKEEARLVAAGQPYLQEVWSDRNWKLFKVADPLPLAEYPAKKAEADADMVTVTLREPGSVLVRIPWSPWLSVVDEKGKRLPPPERMEDNEHGCLRKAPPRPGGSPTPDSEDDPPTDTWTTLEAPAPGVYRLAAPYGLNRGTSCPPE